MSPPPALFPALLGAAEWPRLAPAVRRMHGGEARLDAHGVARVEGAPHWPARLLRRWLGLPEPGAGQALRLEIRRRDGRETWTRHFASRRMRSTLSRGADGRLCERLGPVSLRFALERDGGAIAWRLQGVRWLGLPLPRALCGEVRSRSGAEDGGYAFEVDVRLPLLGRLVAYRGRLAIDDAR
ncbi:DUF4166 domain-containing protein [Fulvimonas soli]|jgi:hypothetical protein|uniref:Uncharacterized protein DUF4166 n=1 Tax=Fulvimonas soli TaxID=155197 RepID=A0A316IJ03_9GAMM|nr:DUF4166 domain-containing protein [Fulvimonas soli]PWK92494.1 uncharacterized protein DUF4166 [Fulvimonas soli]TNY27821.1 saccharopine dehydrogenase [Fulvimonas soli]